MTTLDIKTEQLAETLQTLRESEQRFRIAGQAAYDLIYEWHVETDTLLWFGDVDHFLGYELGEISSSIANWLQLIHSDDMAQLADAVERHRTSTQPIHYQYRIRHKDGKYRYWNDRALPILNDKQEPIRWVGVCQDITLQKQAEAKLVESEEKFRSFFEKNSSEMLLIEPYDGKIVDANQAALKFYGYSHQALLNLNINDINTLDNNLVKAERIAALNEERNYFLFKHRLASGEIRDVEVRSTPIKSHGEDLLFSIIHDITDRIQTRQELEFHLEFQETATKISASFLTNKGQGFDEKINYALKLLGELFKVDRSYVFQYSEDLKTLSNTHEWCAKQIECQMDRVQNLPSEVFGVFNDLIQNDYIHVPDVYDVKEELREVQAEWIEQEIKSLICMPIFGSHRHFFGFIGFDAVNNSHRWSHNDIALLQVLADILGSAIERRRNEDKLQLAASVFTNAREAIIITDADGKIVDINHTFTAMTGYSREETIGQTTRLIKSNLHPSAFYQDLWHTLSKKGYWSGEIWNKKKSGEVYAQLTTISAVEDLNQKILHYVGLFTDITEQKQHQEHLEHVAHYDALTNLPNRVLLSDRIKQMMLQAQRHNRKIAIFYIDLDGFKEINDLFGHEIGDQLLVAVAQNMKQALREEDTLARLGGDEFVAVVIHLSQIKESLPTLERLLKAASKPVKIGQVTHKLSASIGVTYYPQYDELDADQLLRQADQAMYQAKLSGKNRYHVFDEAHDRDTRGYHEQLDRIQKGIEQQEFVLHYQPKVNMKTGELIGVEALIRWQHPDEGLKFPGQFLPIIENQPLLAELGYWVIKEAMRQIQQWKCQGCDTQVSVNIAAIHLQHSEFLSRLEQAFECYPEVKPSNLEFEILETSAMEDTAKVSHVMEVCREKGIEFSVDDFGTGYSSLTYLKRLPATTLKIDQSFVRDMLVDTDDLAILEAVVGMAAAFKRKVIAEGVETIAHGEKLLEMGCEYAQGYVIAKPMPAEDIIKWQKSWQANKPWLRFVQAV